MIILILFHFKPNEYYVFQLTVTSIGILQMKYQSCILVHFGEILDMISFSPTRA